MKQTKLICHNDSYVHKLTCVVDTAHCNKHLFYLYFTFFKFIIKKQQL